MPITKAMPGWTLTLAGTLMIALLAGCGQRASEPGEQANNPIDSVPDGQAEETLAETAEATESSDVSETSLEAEAEVIDESTTVLPDPPELLTPEELAEGWISLFDGQTLYGWKASSDADWRVEDDAIVVGQGDKGLLYTTSQFSNYVLRLEFRCEADVNSGVFLHTLPEPEDPAVDCYELNIAGADNPFPTGSLVFRQKAEAEVAPGQWQPLEVTMDGGHVTVQLNGQQVLDYVDPEPLGRGHIGLQLNSGEIAFRNIRLKPLRLASMFNGKDLAGWKTYPEMPSEFTVTENGELNVKNGRGQLETEISYGDFVLQLDCLTHAEDLNGGIFFRCIPGEEMNGYESQIFNKFDNDDRNQPLDGGTGAIFRRQDARRVVADDLAWFHKTLVVDGPHVSVWVNGYQVNDWTDERPADPNPRLGLRVEPGTIMIQGHDPTTDISFRNMKIAEMAPRNR